MKRNKGKLKCVTDDSGNKSDLTKNSDNASKLKSGSNGKKSSKYTDKSPTKKSKDLRELNEKPGKKNLAKDITEANTKHMPHIVSIFPFLTTKFSPSKKY
mgnify:CR=1 FL=1